MPPAALHRCPARPAGRCRSRSGSCAHPSQWTGDARHRLVHPLQPVPNLKAKPKAQQKKGRMKKAWDASLGQALAGWRVASRQCGWFFHGILLWAGLNTLVKRQTLDQARHADKEYRTGHGRQHRTVVTAMPLHPPVQRRIQGLSQTKDWPITAGRQKAFFRIQAKSASGPIPACASSYLFNSKEGTWLCSPQTAKGTAHKG